MPNKNVVDIRSRIDHPKTVAHWSYSTFHMYNSTLWHCHFSTTLSHWSNRYRTPIVRYTHCDWIRAKSRKLRQRLAFVGTD